LVRRRISPSISILYLAFGPGCGLDEGVEIEEEGLQEGRAQRNVPGELGERGCADVDLARCDGRHDLVLLVAPALQLDPEGAARPGADLACELAHVLAGGAVHRDR
jgi:hypothetical protein